MFVCRDVALSLLWNVCFHQELVPSSAVIVSNVFSVCTLQEYASNWANVPCLSASSEDAFAWSLKTLLFSLPVLLQKQTCMQKRSAVAGRRAVFTRVLELKDFVCYKWRGASLLLVKINRTSSWHKQRWRMENKKKWREQRKNRKLHLEKHLLTYKHKMVHRRSESVKYDKKKHHRSGRNVTNKS